MSRHVGTSLEVLSALFAGATLARLAFGPFRFDIHDVRLSVGTVARPLLLAAVLLVARAWTENRPGRAALITVAASRVALGAVVWAGVIGWTIFLSTTCGGLDSYGYVSAAERVLTGQLIQHEPLAHLMPFADGINAATPLGYTPSPRVADASVPVYPLGLPALMAIATRLAGPTGPFLVAPAMGVLLVGAVYLSSLGLMRDRIVALTAASLTAIHPVVFTYSIQPMSDVPAAALFLTGIALLVHQGRRPVLWPLLAGLAAAICLLTRPALAPALTALVVVPSIAARRLDVRSAALFGVPLTCGVGLHLAVQWYLYGHPLATGYENVEALFSIDRLGANTRSYAYWAGATLGPVFLGTLSVGLAVVPATIRLIVAVVVLTVATPYLVYRTFDHWETLRFLLPALVLLTFPAAAGLLAVGRRVAGPLGGPMVAAAVVLMMASSWTWWLRSNNVFTMPEHETRYRLAGEMVAQATPQGAVILAALHSGSIRYYSGRSSLNWERVPPGALAETVDALHASGHAVFLLTDSEQERQLFEQRHGAAESWLPAGQRRSVQLLEAPGAAGSVPR